MTLKLSELFKSCEQFTCEAGQVYKLASNKKIWWDLTLLSDADKVNFITFVLSSATDRHFYVGYENINIEEDITIYDGIITYDDYVMCKPSLAEFGITFNGEGNHDVTRRLMLLSYQKLLQIKDTPEIIYSYTEDIYDALNIQSVDNAIPTDLFITDTDINANAFAATVETITSKGYIFSYLNCSLRSANDSIKLKIPTTAKEAPYVLTGTTFIEDEYLWWNLCKVPIYSKNFEKNYKLYNFLCSLPNKNICVTATYLNEGANTDALSKISHTHIVDYSISFATIKVLALVHVNTGKCIEFGDFPKRYEDQYLAEISKLTLGITMEQAYQVKCRDKLVIGGLYFTYLNNRLIPIKLKAIQGTFSWTAVKLSELQAYISVDLNGDYTISCSPTDKPNLTRISSDTSAEILTLVDLFHETLPGSQKISEIDSYGYCLLRLLEQIVLDYSKIVSLTDLIVVRKNNEIYVGVVDALPNYSVDGFICTSNPQTVDLVVSQLIPSSIVLEESEPSDILSKIQQETIATRAPSCDYTEFLLKGACSTSSKAYTFEDVMSIDHDDFIEAYIITSLAREQTLIIKEYLWDKFIRQFTSFGLRNLAYYRSPLNIYGGINTVDHTTIEVYSIAMDDIPERGYIT